MIIIQSYSTHDIPLMSCAVAQGFYLTHISCFSTVHGVIFLLLSVIYVYIFPLLLLKRCSFSLYNFAHLKPISCSRSFFMFLLFSFCLVLISLSSRFSFLQHDSSKMIFRAKCTFDAFHGAMVPNDYRGQLRRVYSNKTSPHSSSTSTATQ